MKVTKAQAAANRARVVETASVLFRERGFEGVGVAELMAAAGLTHGAFYKQFDAKAALMAESTAWGLTQTASRIEGVTTDDFLARYLSRRHRDHPASGCTLAALGAEGSRQPAPVRSAFAQGIEQLLASLMPDGPLDADQAASSRAELLGRLAQAVGAIVLSRACPDDSALADEILAACRPPAGDTSDAPRAPQDGEPRRARRRGI